MSNRRRIRVKAIGVLRDGDRLLVIREDDPHTHKTFHIPPGGGVKFGEMGRDCIAREVLEELGAEITDIRYTGTLENIFEYNGEEGHEIVLVYEARLSDPRFCHAESIEGWDDGNDGSKIKITAVWKKLDDFRVGEAVLFPAGLLSLL